MCQTYPDPHTLYQLEAIAGGAHYLAWVCRGVILWFQKEFKQALTALQYAITLQYDKYWDQQNIYWQRFWSDYFGPASYWQKWDAHFWLGMVYLALDQEEEARRAIEQALALEMPPILLRPLAWFEQEKPKLYEQFVKPLLATYEV